jgi:DNA-directed RNA polymerase beta' subunit
MNISACVLYNADFDGDAMNLFFARSTQTRNEIQTLASVGANFISRANGSPMLGCVQDTLVSIAEMTHSGVEINKENAMCLFKSLSLPFTEKKYTGHELISMLLPPINFKTTAKFYNRAYAAYLKYKHSNINVVIEHGKFKQGIMDKNSCGEKKKNNIFHIVYNEYGPTTALTLLFNIQQVTMEFIYCKGFTVSINDILIKPESLVDIHNKTTALIVEANRITDKMQRGLIVPPIGMTVAQFYEQQQINALALSDDFVEPILSNINIETNGLYKMMEMSGKGNMKNFQAIASAMGSQLINGERPTANFGYARTLPYFTRFDTDPVSNGFVPDSLINGVSPASFIFTAQEARFGMINKQLSTSVAGHIGRECIKNLESIITNNLRQCSKNDNIVQSLYGGNGFDSRRTVNVILPTLMISDEALEEWRTPLLSLDKTLQTSEIKDVLDDEFNLIVTDRKIIRENFMTIEHTFEDKMISGKLMSPVNVKKIIDDTIYDFKEANKKPLDPARAMNCVKTFCDELPYIYSNNIQKKAKSRIPPIYKRATVIISALVRSHLCVSQLVKQNISNTMLDLILDKILIAAQKSLIDSGTSVGVIAAQTLSEPMTQYIISSHHRSGVSGGVGDEQTDKLTRNHELLMAKITEKMKNPSMLLFVKEEYENNSIKVGEIANHIESMKLYRFLEELQIFFEEYGKPKHPDYIKEADLISKFESLNPNIIVPANLSRWVIRLELNKLKMILKNMDLETIVFELIRKNPEMFIVYNSENDDNIVLRCYIKNSMFKKTHMIHQSHIEHVKDILINTVIRGVSGIKAAYVRKRNKSFIDKDGAIKSKTVYAIKTKGTNLEAIMENPFLDVKLCTTDSIKEIEEVYGIEAARHMLYAELEKLIPGMHPQHYSIFSDEMSFTGRVTGISKAGLEKRETHNVLLRASYNFTLQVLKNAAVNNRHSKIYGMSASLMVGRTPEVGSCYNKIAVDYDFVKDNVKSVDDIVGDL